MTTSAIWQNLKNAAVDFFDDDAMTQAAALAFYTALSFAPLLMILLYGASFLGPQRRDDLVNEVAKLIGPEASTVIDAVATQAREQRSARTLAGAVSLAVLLFSASGVFAQLQAALNRIWDVKPRPGLGVWGWLRKRLLSAGMIFAVLFLLMVSMAVSAALTAVPGESGPAWRVVELTVSLFVFTLLFALIFKYLPDVSIGWPDVWFGGGATALLFTAGKWAIGLYLGKGAVGSAYGAAGSLVALLVWVYYSAIILFFGAELTQAYAHLRGSRIEPDQHAIWIDPAQHPSAERSLPA